MYEHKMSPVLKWAGGKTQLLDRIAENLPPSYNRYFEPFVGGAAVLFFMAPKKAFVNDSNRQLINLYQQIKTSAEDMIAKVNEMDTISCDKALYYHFREKYNAKISQEEYDVEAAALLIWLNKHCFNGLYRVNKKGLFNVPYNDKKSGKSIDTDNVRLISDYLRRNEVTITCLDFEEACAEVLENDFVYFDSPYIPESETAYFTDYTMNGFTWEDHKRLERLFR